MTVIKSAIIKSYDAAAHKATVQIAGSLGVWLDGIRVATDIPAADVVAGRQCTVLFLDLSNQDDAVVITIQGAIPLVYLTSAQVIAAAKTIKLDDFTAPDDNTDLDATTSKHGLLKKLGGGTTNFLRADGAWAAPPGGGGGGDNHAPVGALVPGVLSTGLKSPQVPYYGDGDTFTKLYCRVSVVPAGATITVRPRRGVGEGASAILGAAATIAIGNHLSNVVAFSQAIASGDFFEVNIHQVGTSPNQGSDLVWLVAP